MVRAVLRNVHLFVLGGLFLSIVPRASAQPSSDSCRTPQSSAQTFLANLQDGEERPSLAVRCFEWGETPRRQRAVLARRLKAVLDQRGLYVDVDDLPSDAEVEDDDGRIELNGGLPEIYLHQVEARWLISSESVAEIEGLYAETFSVDVEELVENLPTWMKAPVLPGLALWQVLGLLLAVLMGFFVRWLVGSVVANQGARLIKRSGYMADVGILRGVGRPIGTLALAAILWWVLPLLRLTVRVNQIGSIALRVLAAAAVVMIAYRLVDLGADVFARRAEKTETKLDDQLVPLIRRAMKAFVAAIGVIFVLQNLDVDVGSLIAGASLGGLAFTLAAKDTVANLFGSISIFADQPFQVGDWVTINDMEGTVEEVGMRSTRIRTFYDSLISIPNSVVANAPVDNYGQRRFRRCNITIGLTYDTSTDQMQAFIEGVRAILKANHFVRDDKYEVHFRNFGASALEVMVYCFFEVDTWTLELRERQNVFLEIMRLADAVQVEFAFPTQTLHLERSERDSAPQKPSREELAELAKAFGPGGDRSTADSGDIAGGFWREGME